MDMSRRAAASNRRASNTATASVLDRSQTGGRNEPASGASDTLRESNPSREEAAICVIDRATGAAPILASRCAHVVPFTENADGHTNSLVVRDALRPALLAGAAACALILAAAPSPAQAQQVIVNPPGTVPDECTFNSTDGLLICEGDLGDGINITRSNSGTSTLDNLTEAIAPASGVDGVLLVKSFLGGRTTLTVDAADYGITTINAAGVRGNPTTSGSFTINVTGDITVTGSADAAGIIVSPNEGHADITSVGAITVATGDGITVSTPSGGNITINSTGDISAGANGIRADATRRGLAASVVSNGNITATTGHAIDASANYNATVISTGIINGANGLRAVSAYSQGQFARYVASVTSYAGDITVAGTGVYAKSESGDATVDVKEGTIRATNGDGILVLSNEASALATTYGSVYSGGYGIDAHGHNGASVKAFGETIDAGLSGIEASATRAGVTVESTSNIMAADDGIAATTSAGDAIVYSTGTITSVASGIRAATTEGSASVTSKNDITVSDVTGYAIGALSQGSGGVTIVSEGALKAEGFDAGGIHAQTTSRYGDISIKSTGPVTVGGSGILATAFNETYFSGGQALDAGGDIDITSYGTVTAGSNDGIRAGAQRGNVTITSVGAVSGGDHAIAALAGNFQSSSGTRYGDVRITSDGALSAGQNAINAYAYGLVSISSKGDLTAGDSGIYAESYDGSVSVYSNGAIEANGEGAFGIRAFANYNGASVESIGSITADDETAFGIYAAGRTDDEVKITSNGAVFAGLTGLSATVLEGSGEVFIDSVGAVSGVYGYGIIARANSGAVTVKSDGYVSGEEAGVFAVSNTGSVSVTSIGKVTATGGGGTTGIFAAGVGTVSVNSTGNIVAAADTGVGIKAEANDDATDVSVFSNGDVSAGGNGIDAFIESGSGDIVIDSAGDVVGARVGYTDIGYGIRARANTGGVKITSDGSVSGKGRFAIFAENVGAEGSGDIAVNSTGALTGAQGGVRAVSTYGDVSIFSEGAADATDDGSIGVFGKSTHGDVVVQSDGRITHGGRTGGGIGGGSVYGNVEVVSSSDVTSKNVAIFGYSVYDGDVSISSSGAVTVSGYVPSDIFSGIGILGFGPGNVTIESAGPITAAVDGIFASVTGDGDITINSTGDVTGGSGAGVRFAGGASNRLENRGTIKALSGVAVVGAAGVETVLNFGTLEGEVSLAAGNDVFELYDEGDVSAADLDGGEGDDTFRLAGTGVGVLAVGGLESFEIFEKTGSGTWSLVDDLAFVKSADILGGVLDLQGALTSPIVANTGGSLAVGGVGIVGAGTIDGNYVQEAGGDYHIDIDFENSAVDLLSVTGIAALAGTVTPNALNIVSGEYELTILTAAGGVTDNGLTLNPFASPLVDASLVYPNANDVVLSVIIAFSPEGVDFNDNQTTLVANLESLFDAGAADGALSGVFDALLFDIDSNTAYVDALNELTPGIFLSTQTASLFAAEAFSDSLFSCADKADVRAASREGECLWLKVSGGVLDVDGEAQSISFDEEKVSFSAGWQIELDETWRVGVAAGYETSSIDDAVGGTSDGERLMAGVSVKHLRGPWRLSAAVSGGFANYETIRIPTLGGFSDSLLSDHDVDHAAAELRFAYQLDVGRWFAKPFVEANGTWLSLSDATENGGGAALAIDGEDETFFSVTPGLELGGDLVLSETLALRPFLRAGASFYANTELGLSARFAGGLSGDSGFGNVSAIDDLYADVKAGVTLFEFKGRPSNRDGRFSEYGSRVAVSLVYEGRFGENTKQNSAFIKAAFPF